MKVNPATIGFIGGGLLVLAVIAHILHGRHNAGFAALRAGETTPQVLADALETSRLLSYATGVFAGLGLLILIIAVIVIALRDRS